MAQNGMAKDKREARAGEQAVIEAGIVLRNRALTLEQAVRAHREALVAAHLLRGCCTPA